MSPKRTTKRVTIPAKISAPHLTETYDRRRLFRTLDRARRTKRVVWISAPAGAGKTSVVTTYLRARRLRALWYNVDIRDADVAHVFHYLAMAARVASPRRTFRFPAFAVENQAGVAAFARGFFEALFRQLPSSSVVVIDDYQEARSELWDEVVREAIGALPHGIGAIGRKPGRSPTAPRPRVASGAVALLGTDDFRLTPLETSALIRLYRPDLRGAKLKGLLPRISELANGWAAALALLLQNQRVVSADQQGIEDFSGRFFDYVATEILDKAPPAERDFLLRTSVVPTLTSAVAFHLAETEDATRILADLERRSFLTQRLGNSGTYRYHPLLRGFLLKRAELELGRAAVQQLHRTAAESLVADGPRRRGDGAARQCSGRSCPDRPAAPSCTVVRGTGSRPYDRPVDQPTPRRIGGRKCLASLLASGVLHRLRALASSRSYSSEPFACSPGTRMSRDST